MFFYDYLDYLKSFLGFSKRPAIVFRSALTLLFGLGFIHYVTLARESIRVNLKKTINNNNIYIIACIDESLTRIWQTYFFSKNPQNELAFCLN